MSASIDVPGGTTASEPSWLRRYWKYGAVGVVGLVIGGVMAGGGPTKTVTKTVTVQAQQSASAAPTTAASTTSAYSGPSADAIGTQAQARLAARGHRGLTVLCTGTGSSGAPPFQCQLEASGTVPTKRIDGTWNATVNVTASTAAEIVSVGAHKLPTAVAAAKRHVLRQDAAAERAYLASLPKPLVITGSGTENLPPIVVRHTGWMVWSCPSCGSDNFIIEDSGFDALGSVNALDQTSGRTWVTAGRYTGVQVVTEGGAWTLTFKKGR